MPMLGVGQVLGLLTQLYHYCLSGCLGSLRKEKLSHGLS